ncbi:unnamed protein product [Amoebophrya sp. A120]|nr:unnamed protein product [Amoebophrya sp. A120]|eukprot:GSA120T00021642001.1
MSILSPADLRKMIFEWVCKAADIIHTSRVPPRSDRKRGKRSTSFQLVTHEESNCRSVLGPRAQDFFENGLRQVLVFDVFEAEQVGTVRRTSSTLSHRSMAASQQSSTLPSPDDCETVNTNCSPEDVSVSPGGSLLLNRQQSLTGNYTTTGGGDRSGIVLAPQRIGGDRDRDRPAAAELRPPVQQQHAGTTTSAIRVVGGAEQADAAAGGRNSHAGVLVGGAPPGSSAASSSSSAGLVATGASSSAAATAPTALQQASPRPLMGSARSVRSTATTTTSGGGRPGRRLTASWDDAEDVVSLCDPPQTQDIATKQAVPTDLVRSRAGKAEDDGTAMLVSTTGVAGSSLSLRDSPGIESQTRSGGATDLSTQASTVLAEDTPFLTRADTASLPKTTSGGSLSSQPTNGRKGARPPRNGELPALPLHLDMSGSARTQGSSTRTPVEEEARIDMQASWGAHSNASSRASESTRRPRRRVVERWVCGFGQGGPVRSVTAGVAPGQRGMSSSQSMMSSSRYNSGSRSAQDHYDAGTPAASRATTTTGASPRGSVVAGTPGTTSSTAGLSSLSGSTSGTSGQQQPSGLTLRRLDERVMRKLSTACRSLLVLTRVLPSYNMARKKVPLYMHIYFADPNVVLSPVPEELLQVPSSIGTLTFSLARGRQSSVTRRMQATTPLIVRNSQLYNQVGNKISVSEGYVLDQISHDGLTEATDLFSERSKDFRPPSRRNSQMQYQHPGTMSTSGLLGESSNAGSASAHGPRAGSAAASSSTSGERDEVKMGLYGLEGESSSSSLGGDNKFVRDGLQASSGGSSSVMSENILVVEQDQDEDSRRSRGSGAVEMEMRGLDELSPATETPPVLVYGDTILESSAKRSPNPSAEEHDLNGSPPDHGGRTSSTSRRDSGLRDPASDGRSRGEPPLASAAEELGRGKNAFRMQELLQSPPDVGTKTAASREKATSSSLSSSSQPEDSRTAGRRSTTHQSPPQLPPGMLANSSLDVLSPEHQDGRYDASPLLRELNPFLPRVNSEEQQDQVQDAETQALMEAFVISARALQLDDLFGRYEDAYLTQDELSRRLAYYSQRSGS